MIELAAHHSYELRAVGEQIKSLPDFPVIIRPLVDTTLHAFAEAPWVFKVTHSCGVRVPKRSPNITLYRTDTRHVCLSFRVSSRLLYKGMDEVFADLKNADYDFKSVTAQFAANTAVQEDELTALQRFNAARYEDIKERVDRSPSVPPENVLDFSKLRDKLRPVEDTEVVQERVAKIFAEG